MVFLDLFRPRWKHSDCEVRRATVKKITDQALLADVAKSASYFDVRWAAFKKLTDQALLADLAKNDSNPDVRLTAADKLTDQALAQAV